MSQIIVLAEHDQGSVVKATLNAIGAAKKLAEITGGGFDIAIAGHQVSGLAAELTGYGAEKVWAIEDPTLEGYTAQAYAQAFHKAIAASEASYVIAASTARGKDCTPRVAARLDAGMASDVIGIEGSSDALVYVRPMWAGNIISRVKINTDTHVMTIRTTDFDAVEESGGASPISELAAGIDAGSIRMRYIKLDSVKSDRPALTDASVVVSGGRGVQSAENFDKVIAPLADGLGAAIGASRAVVDSGWVPNDWQVGQTGKVVAPQLYIAAGISGAIQHLAGMKGSKTIVAINKDPEAPIFQVADYGLVADLFEAVPELTNKLKDR
jgi:electron transfer flavoprotein alpha subunit